MYKINKIEIEGFWGRHTIEANIHDDVTIFIGKNGAGKTHFINIVQAVLFGKIEQLMKLKFETVTIDLHDEKEEAKKRTVKIKVTKKFNQTDKNSDHIAYSINKEQYVIPVVRILRHMPSSRNRRYGNFHDFSSDEKLCEKLNSLIQLSFLSVYREEHMSLAYEEVGIRDERRKNGVDTKLEKLMNQLTSYQLQIEAEISDKSREFQNNVLEKILYDERLDSEPIVEVKNGPNRKPQNEPPSEKELNEFKNKLKETFKTLGNEGKMIKKQIDKHIEKYAEACENAIKIKNSNKGDYQALDKLMKIISMIPLFNRSIKIIELYENFSDESKKIKKPINNYLKLLKEFIAEKEFDVSSKEQGGLIVKKGDEKFPIKELSSGEKQLIIFLTETLLQKEEPRIFLADEPELSLHIAWQKKLLSSVLELNPNAQIIAATHSPEIVADWQKKIFNMENITI